MNDEPTEMTDQPVYAVYEYTGGGRRLRMVFEDDAETLREAIDYLTGWVESDGDSDGAPREFHAANPGEAYLDRGDWYLTKEHGVGVSQGLIADE